MRALVALVVASMLGGCSSGESTEPAESPRPSPGITLEGAELSETRDGQKIWDLKARTVAYRTEPGIAELAGVTTRFYENGEIVSMGEAPSATFHLADRKLQLEGGIQIRAEGGQAGFSAARVTVVPDPGHLVAEGEVTFFRGPNRLMATGLVADRSLRRVELTGGTTGRFSLAPDGTPVVPVPSPGI